MRSTITSCGQTVIPAEVRRFFNLSTADRLEWVIENNTIRIIPVRETSIDAFRGSSKCKGATARLLADRVADRERE
jgi:AbrB family looped-hinge helix DNA binding protein